MEEREREGREGERERKRERGRDRWTRVWETQEKSMSFVFTWGLGVFLAVMIWSMCPLKHPRTDQNKDRVQVSFLSNSIPEVRGLGSKCLEIILENFYDNPAQSLLRYYLLCWKSPNISLSLCHLQGGNTLFALQGKCRVEWRSGS